MAEKNEANEIHLTRIYEAPLKAVWEAWTDPEQVKQWWGPRGFTLTTHSKDLKPGGHWSYTMHGPDGTEFPNTTKYLEVENGSKLVYDHGGHEDRPPLFRVTAHFSENQGKTTMDLSLSFPTPEAAEETRQFIKKVGGDSTWDRLSEYLEQKSTGKEKFVITRSFDAPLKLMFEMWTKPEPISKWLPPIGFDMEFIKCEIKPGGRSFYFMTDHKKVKMYGRAEYLKLQGPHLLLYTQQFCDENEKVSRHPMAPIWPETMLTTVQIAEEGANRTRVTVTWEPHGTVTRAELEVFIRSRGGMTLGWTGSFDKLESYLSNIQKA
jgi:uncharacterized protein YndB with AHSA1/START domain